MYLPVFLAIVWAFKPSNSSDLAYCTKILCGHFLQETLTKWPVMSSLSDLKWISLMVSQIDILHTGYFRMLDTRVTFHQRCLEQFLDLSVIFYPNCISIKPAGVKKTLSFCEIQFKHSHKHMNVLINSFSFNLMTVNIPLFLFSFNDQCQSLEFFMKHPRGI